MTYAARPDRRPATGESHGDSLRKIADDLSEAGIPTGPGGGQVRVDDLPRPAPNVASRR